MEMQINYWPVLSLFSFVDPFNLCSLLFALFAFCVLITFSLCMVCKKKGEQKEREIVLLFEGEKQKRKKYKQISIFSWSQFMCRGVFPFQILRYNTFSARDYLYSFSKYLRGGKRGTEKEREEQGVAMGLGNDRWGMWFTAEELKKTGNCRL